MIHIVSFIQPDLISYTPCRYLPETNIGTCSPNPKMKDRKMQTYVPTPAALIDCLGRNCSEFVYQFIHAPGINLIKLLGAYLGA
jgi:hypothetical protein